MRHRALVVLSTCLLGLAGCVTLFHGDIERDRVALRAVASKLACGMTENDVNQRVGGKLEKMAGPGEGLTHIYRLELANLWLVFNERGLKSSQVYYVNGLTSLGSEQVLEYCK